MANCERCGNTDPGSLTMSYFNTQMICEACEINEVGHPKYKEAREAENRAVRYGNYNFAGIGLPADLEVKNAK